MTVLVLGVGRVGALIARDLSPEFEVVAIDSDPKTPRLDALANVVVDQADLSDAGTLRRLIRAHQPTIVIGALPSAMGFATLKTVIECGVDVCDISFMPEDPLALDGLARSTGVRAIVDCGVMPGLGNVFAGRAVAELPRCERIDIYVGGVPRTPKPPYYYKAAFAPLDVIEEYRRPARQKEGGALVVRDALSEVERVTIDGTELEAFNTDGLRTLLTLPVPNMKEKTLRWPGHAAVMAELLASRTFDATALIRAWEYEDGEEDVTFMKVVASGSGRTLEWELVDHPRDGFSSMSRTTAFPCTTVARLVAAGGLGRTGVMAPETLGRDPRLYAGFLTELERKGLGIRYRDRPGARLGAPRDRR